MKKVRQYLTLLLLASIAAHLYEYGCSAPTPGTPDIQAISIAVAHDIEYMNTNGIRRTGTGIANGMLNNTETWFTSRRGCSAQADIVASDLQVQFHDWKFLVVASPLHHWIEAYNGNGTVLRIDPWTGEVSKKI